MQHGEKSNTFGEKQGPSTRIDIPVGHTICKVYIWKGWYVDSIQFETDKGYKSSRFGGSGGGLETFSVCNVVGVCGKEGKLIDYVTFNEAIIKRTSQQGQWENDVLKSNDNRF